MGHTKVNVNLRINFCIYLCSYFWFEAKFCRGRLTTIHIYKFFIAIFIFHRMPPQHNSPPPHFKCVRVCVFTLAANCFCRIKIALKACLLIS